MAEVDADDDTIRRFVVLHYRYDPDRNERRNVVVAAFDDETPFRWLIDEMAAELRARRAAGDLQDPHERISGATLEAGHRALQRNAHLARRSIEHGVVPPDLDDLPLPSNTAVLRFNRVVGDQAPY